MKAIHKKRIRKWVRALLSGKYRQTREMLHRKGGGYCCLGVACEVFKQDTGKGEWKLQAGDCAMTFEVPDGGSVEVLPESVRTYFGLPEGNPSVVHDNYDRTLGECNDEHKMKFPTIAKAIRATFLRKK